MTGSSDFTFSREEKQVIDTKPLLLEFDAVSSRTQHVTNTNRGRKEYQ